MVFAAASLQDAMHDVTDAYPDAVVVSYGGSGAMARQIAQGAPADVVVLANSAWMDWLQRGGYLRPNTRRDLLGNRLVMVGPMGAPPLPEVSGEALIARLAGGRLALGQTTAVPAGIYARAWMEHAGLWEGLRPHLAETDNVRAALALVALGEAPLGMVYATDAAAETRVVTLYAVPRGAHSPIVYPVAAITERGEDFVAYLARAEVQDTFRVHGFTLPGVEQ
ncbi:molybdate ABC transporter substrate-binding protein [Roseovarius pelagicus]|uniref:Molybdate ABC transporter substrate-binding protein n=1 Tax=Roseovarius pelagicus TaxID=2980108 RepID=A0ABY6DBK9_9RHOB|nr:molybdate ABC transporter substrate-binding protein [Roseovarius pelagicus]UXX82965.1 molybdate ABC transporter substrate-binding protein [Roseovarius pelagicus]